VSCSARCLLCANAQLAQVGVVAIDGTKIAADAHCHAVMDCEQNVRALTEEAKQIDGAEDELYGPTRRMSCRRSSRCARGRAGWLLEAERLDEQRPRLVR
jgi:hypothetical protein